MLSDSALWKLYAQAISSHAGASGEQVFSAAGPMTFVTPATADIPAANWSAYELGDGVPALSGVYAPRSGVFASYWLYLTYLAEAAVPAPPGNAMGVLSSTGLQSDLERYRQALLARAEPRTVAGASFDGLLDTASLADAQAPADNLESSHDTVVAALGSRAPAITAALNQCLLASMQIATTQNMPAMVQAGGTVFRCPQYAIEGFLPGYLSWRDPAHAGTSALLVSLPPPGVAGATILQAAASSNEVWPAFLGSGLQMAAHQQNGSGVLTAAMPDTGCSCAIAGLTLSLGGFGAFDLSRGSWFSADLPDDDATALPAHAPDFFSASGALSTLPFKAVIGYQPRIVLHATDAQAAQMLAATLANVGPFTVANGNGAPAPSLTCGTCNGTTVSFDAAESSVPVLLGVISCPASAALAS